MSKLSRICMILFMLPIKQGIGYASFYKKQVCFHRTNEGLQGITPMAEEWDDNEEMTEEETESELFPFRLEEKAIVDETIALVRELIRLPSLTPLNLHLAAKLLLALIRLPRPTPGIAIDMTISYRLNDDLSYRGIFISEDSFRLQSGGSIYTPGVGSDSYSDDSLEIEISGYRSNVSFYLVSGWIDSCRELLNMSAKVSFEDLGDDDVDWDIEDAEDYWDKLNEEDE